MSSDPSTETGNPLATWIVVVCVCIGGVLWLARSRPAAIAPTPLSNPPSVPAVVELPPLPPANPAPAVDADLETRLRKHRPLEEPRNGFVGSAECRECHKHNHETWHDSYHRTMTQFATPETVIGDFDNNHVQLPDTPDYRLSQRDGKFWVNLGNQDDIDFGPPGTRQDLPVVMTTGSHHMQVYWLAMGIERTLGVLPILYLKEEQRWIPRKAAWISPPNDLHRFGPGSWNKICSKCHATHGFNEDDKRETLPNPAGQPFAAYDSKVAELGIACEACHGPGENHLKLHRDGELAPGVKDLIVDPSNLSHQRSSEVCAGCHSMSETAGEDDQWLDFHAGLKLEDSRYLKGRDEATIRRLTEEHGDVTPEQARRRVDFEFSSDFWPDGAPRGSGTEFSGMRQSGCYQRGEMSCISCHRMHQAKDDPRSRKEWADDQLGVGMRGNQACTQCHDPIEFGPKHTHHGAGSSGSLCYNCHMPFSTWGLMKGIRNHSIRSPQVKDSAPNVRPNACNLCHLDQPLQWSAAKLADWYGHPRPTLAADEKKIAAGVLWTLQGDAAQRAVVAHNFGRAAAQEISGREWMPPIVSYLMRDPYHVVRYAAGKSLRTLPGFREFEFDFVASSRDLGIAGNRVIEQWERQSDRPRDVVRLLMNPAGKLDKPEAARLLEGRNHRPVHVSE